MKIWSRIPRYSLLWLSKDEIATVRNRFIGLFLKPAECVEVAPPAGLFDVSNIRIYTGVSPRFEFRQGAINRVIWLKFPTTQGLPVWDVTETALGALNRVKFNDPLARVPAEIIRGLTVYFPFVSTGNYLSKNGECIA